MFWVALGWEQSLFPSKIRVEEHKTSRCVNATVSVIYTVTLARLFARVLEEKRDCLQSRVAFLRSLIIFALPSTYFFSITTPLF